MKKLSHKDYILLWCVVIFIGFYLFYIYYWKPFDQDLQIKKDERLILRAENEGYNPNQLTDKLNQLQTDLSIEEEGMKKDEEEKTITVEKQETLLLNIGMKAKEMDINLVKFEEKSHHTSGSYTVVPYEIKARGDNEDLILFLNSLYGTYRYFYIDNINMRKIKIISEFERPSQVEVNLEDTITSNWSENYLDLIHMDLPEHLIPKKSTQRASQTEEEPKKYDTVLQLDLTLYFISKNE